VPGIRRSPSGRRPAESLSAVPGSRTRETEKPLETPGGGRSRPRTTNALRHRRAASRSGGAASAERDGRPVHQRTITSAAPGSESLRTHDSWARHLFGVRGWNPRPCRSPTLLAAAFPDPVPAAAAVAVSAAAADSPKRARRSQSSLKRVLRKTGLLSRSAAPPLQLDSLRRPESRRPIDRQRSPPVVPTAFLVPVARFSVTRFPRIARLDNVHLESRTALAHCQTRHVPPLRPFSYTPGHENHGPRWAREFANRRVCRP
jgi:hypothetical protein